MLNSGDTIINMVISENLKTKIEKFINGFSLRKEPLCECYLSTQATYGCNFGCADGCLSCIGGCTSCTGANQ